jgi:predicted dehydrogenase
MERRKFIRNTSVAGTSFLFGPKLSSLGFYKGSPNNKVVVAHMGVNSRGAFLSETLAKFPNVDIAYICDVDSKVLTRQIGKVQAINGKAPQGMGDIRKLLEKKDFDALVIAAPDHWHAPATILACQAGKHVYCEKPCSHNPHEGEMAVAAAAKYNRVVQLGTQRRSFVNVTQMVTDLHQGIIGRVYFAKAWYTNHRDSIGIGKIMPVPDNLNYELWQGYAPRKPYKNNLIHYNWHWFWNWGTGEALNNGTHEIDVMRWGLGVDYPNKVTSSGGRFAFKDDWQTPDTQVITANFPNNTAMTWEGRSCNSFIDKDNKDGRGVIFFGDQGTIYYGGGDGYMVYDGKNKVIKEVKESVAADANNTVSPTATLDGIHLNNFISTVQGNATLNQPLLQGHRSTLIPQLGNIAQRTGGMVNCDPTNGHIIDNPEAMRLWHREYELGWVLKV